MGRVRVGWWSRHVLLGNVAVGCVVLLSGCSHLRPKPAKQYVYVTAKQTYLRDRVAAVSNRTATVTNGEKLQVLEQGRRFLEVVTEKGERGWIDDKAVATPAVYEAFQDLKRKEMDDPAVASAVVRDEVYLHIRPGRETERFYLLNEGEKLKMLRRATVPKPLPPGQRPVKPKPAAVGGEQAVLVSGKAGSKGDGAGSEPAAPVGPAMEDWWLVRDSKGDTGWIYSRMIDVDAPDALTRYSEGQRIVGAYVLATVNDPEAPQDDKNVPEYVTVQSPYKAGLPYDFDQVRVFTWNVKKHRYETGFREKNIEGYLPVTIGRASDPYGKGAAAEMVAPTFTYRVLAADAAPVVPDPVTGAVVPGKTIVKTYRLEGNMIRRVLQPGSTPEPEAHPEPVAEKKAGRRRHR